MMRLQLDLIIKISLMIGRSYQRKTSKKKKNSLIEKEKKKEIYTIKKKKKKKLNLTFAQNSYVILNLSF